jgi:hypothetical protein
VKPRLPASRSNVTCVTFGHTHNELCDGKLGRGYSSSRTALSSTPRSRLTISSCLSRLVLIPFTAVTRSPAHSASQRCATLPGRKLVMLGHRPLSTPPDMTIPRLEPSFLTSSTAVTPSSSSVLCDRLPSPLCCPESTDGVGLEGALLPTPSSGGSLLLLWCWGLRTRHSFITACSHHGRRFLDDNPMLLAVYLGASSCEGEDNGEADLLRIPSQHETIY